MIKSVSKHTRGSREFFRLCRQAGLPAAKGGLPGLSVEVRRTQRLHLERAMAEAVSAAGTAVPVLAHRSDGHPWRITLRLEDFLCLYRAYLQSFRPDPESPEAEACHSSDPDPDRLPADAPVP